MTNTTCLDESDRFLEYEIKKIKNLGDKIVWGKDMYIFVVKTFIEELQYIVSIIIIKGTRQNKQWLFNKNIASWYL